MPTINLKSNPKEFFLFNVIDEFFRKTQKKTFTMDDLWCDNEMLEKIYAEVYLPSCKFILENPLENPSWFERADKSHQIIDESLTFLIDQGFYKEFSSSVIGRIIIFLYKYKFSELLFGKLIRKLKITQKIKNNLIFVRNYPLDSDQIYQNFSEKNTLWKGIWIGGIIGTILGYLLNLIIGLI